MIYPIVDLGSNTIRLCVYEHNGITINKILDRKTMVGLTNFVIKEKLSKNGVDRICEILNEYKNILNIFHIKQNQVHIFATASLRNIANTREVIEEIKENTGYEVELLSGEEEATLDFIGATRLITKENGILVDIGGGSTEIVVFKNRKIIQAASMPIGSLNLYVKHVKKIIPKEEERKIIRKDVQDHLMELELQQEVFQTICGVGGTMHAARKLNNSIYNLYKENMEIDVSHISGILDLIHNSKRQTITPILQNIPDRIHTIIPGLIIADTIADYFECENILVSNYGIREGYLYGKVLKGE